MTLTNLLTQYNELATRLGQPTIKGPWKKPKDALQERYDALQAAAKEDGGLSVADIARELEVSPKVARAKLRRAGMKASDGRWAKVAKGSKEYKALVAILKVEAK